MDKALDAFMEVPTENVWLLGARAGLQAAASHVSQHWEDYDDVFQMANAIRELPVKMNHA